MRGAWFVMVILILSSVSLPLFSEEASAHSPTFPGNNSSLNNATFIEDPSKSWAIYSHLEEGTFQYFAVDLKAGDRLYLSLIMPTHEKGTGFNPDMAILGPFSYRNGTLPSGIESPAGLGWMIINGTMPATPTYEAFSPSAFYDLAAFDEAAPADGRYYIVVFQDPGSVTIHGDYGLAVGYIESFTLTEFVLVPISLLNVYQWEGQSLLQVFVPIAAVLLVGLFAFNLKKKESFAQMGVAPWFALVSGLLFLGTATNTVIQTIISLATTGLVAEVFLTMIFIIVPLLLGWLLIRIALRGGLLPNRARIEMFVIGVAGLFVWAGLIIGPIIAMVGSIMPGNRKGRSGRR